MENNIQMKIERVSPDAVIPVRAKETDSGMDVFAYKFMKIFGKPTDAENLNEAEYVVLPPKGRVLVSTGIKATVGPGYEIQVRPRSGLALNKGLTVLNSPGTVDEQYRGEIGVILINASGTKQTIRLGERIAQLVVSRVELVSIVEVKSLDTTERGAGGFGHTGT